MEANGYLATIFAGAIGLTIKHFLADYIFQTQYMLRKTAPENWVWPLTFHAGVHGVMTAAVFVILVGPWGVLFGLLDSLLHWGIDFWKARLTSSGMNTKRFWIELGLDQMLHYLTYILLIYLAVRFLSDIT